MIRIIQTGDIHGCFFPYDLLERKEATACLARISSYIREQRKKLGENLVLLDAGDLLQGQPSCYHSLSIDPKERLLAAEVLDNLGYDAMCIGNHDIETGHEVFDKLRKETHTTILAANIMRSSDGKPYFQPYKMIERGDVRIAVIGLCTTAIPYWLNERLWRGLTFEDPVESASRWIEHIEKKEEPDFIIGLFHTGWQGGIETDGACENAARRIAREVDGFDEICFGHDHIRYTGFEMNSSGNYLGCMNASSNAMFFNEIDLHLRKAKKRKPHGKYRIRVASTRIKKAADFPIDTEFMSAFQNKIDRSKKFFNTIIGKTAVRLSTRECSTGDCPLAALIHGIQQDVSGAQISFAAPLAYDITLNGDIRNGDIFNLYKYESTIYAMRMMGKEIRNYLEYCYDLWICTMEKPSDHILKMETYTNGKEEMHFFKNLTFNFDTAYGINYTVDVRKPYGRRIHIRCLSDGGQFEEEASYTVAMHSYRGNGGNEFMTRGAGIPHGELKERIVFESERGHRDYIIRKITEEKSITPLAAGNWSFEPSEWTEEALKRDSTLVFRMLSRED